MHLNARLPFDFISLRNYEDVRGWDPWASSFVHGDESDVWHLRIRIVLARIVFVSTILLLLMCAKTPHDLRIDPSLPRLIPNPSGLSYYDD